MDVRVWEACSVVRGDTAAPNWTTLIEIPRSRATSSAFCRLPFSLRTHLSIPASKACTLSPTRMSSPPSLFLGDHLSPSPSITGVRSKRNKYNNAVVRPPEGPSCCRRRRCLPSLLSPFPATLLMLDLREQKAQRQKAGREEGGADRQKVLVSCM